MGTRKWMLTVRSWPDDEHPGYRLVELDDGRRFAAIRTDADLDDRERWGVVMADLMRALVRDQHSRP